MGQKNLQLWTCELVPCALNCVPNRPGVEKILFFTGIAIRFGLFSIIHQKSPQKSLFIAPISANYEKYQKIIEILLTTADIKRILYVYTISTQWVH